MSSKFMPSEVEASSTAPRCIRQLRRSWHHSRGAVADASTSLGIN